MAEVTAEILVVRPQPGADETVRALSAAGFRARALPVLERRPLPETAALRQRIQALAEYDVVVFVSPAAVELGMAWIDRYWPQYPVTVRWVAVGEGTRRALVAWGIDAAAPESDERSEGMLALPELTAVAEKKVLIIRGVGGRPLLREQLRERGAEVDVLELYSREPIAVDLPQPETVAAVVVSSVAVLDALVANGGTALRDRPIVVPSPRVLEAARTAGFRRVHCAGRAGAAATVAAVRALQGDTAT